MRTTAALFLSLLALGTPALAQQATAPAPAAAKKAAVYDEKADAKADISAALARAKKQNKRVLVQWGANWCGWCVKLDGTMKSDPKLAEKMRNEYELVKVDVARFDKNTDLFTGYGAKLKESGIPYLTVLDADGKVLANQESGALEKGDGHDVAKVLEFLASHETARVDADDLLATAISSAGSEGKSIFLHFGAPWCGWCHRMEAWMAEPKVSEILAKDFIDCKIDTDRNTDGGAMHRRFNPLIDKPGGGGIPWFVFVDAKGKSLIDSNGPEGNTGFPSQDAEIAHFVAMIRKVRKNITDADVATLEESLKAAAKSKGH